MDPWETNHKAAQAYGVERLNEAIEAVRQATGWIGILPETSDHVTAMLGAVGNQLKSILNQVDRPNGLADFDEEAAERDEDQPIPLLQPGETAKVTVPAPPLYRIDEHGDMDTGDPDVRQ